MSYQVHQYNHNKRSPEENFLRILWAVISAPFRLVGLLFGHGRNGKSRRSPEGEGGLDKSYIDSKWQEIEQLMQLGSPSNYSRAVLEADKLLDHILKGYRAPGMTMGDRLKASQNRFSKDGYNAAWQAHKVRNELVHNSRYQVLDYVAKTAINNFKKAIDELI